MRQTISGLVVAIAVVTASTAPALACGGGLFTGSCAPCGQAYVSPCSQGYDGGYDYLASHRVAAYELLPERSPQYFYADQGPTFSGPGMFAPAPIYQESAVSGWGAYRHNPYYYGYDGGRYANAANHYYDGMPAAEGPAIYRYRSHSHFRSWHPRTGHYGYATRMHSTYWSRRSYAPHHSDAPRYSLPQYYAPRHSMRYGAYRFAGPRYYGHREQVLRRLD
jgi:hypothetical protein